MRLPELVKCLTISHVLDQESFLNHDLSGFKAQPIELKSPSSKQYPR
jgi:hypothetical protein